MFLGRRLGPDGALSFAEDFGNLYIEVDGTIGFRVATGTALANSARLTDDGHDAQLCTTGDLTWTAARRSARPARAAVSEGAGILRVTVSNGVADVVKRVEPRPSD